MRRRVYDLENRFYNCDLLNSSANELKFTTKARDDKCAVSYTDSCTTKTTMT
jgi:hypothetical protein